MRISAIRRVKLNEWIKEYKTNKLFAEAAGIEPGYLSQLKMGKESGGRDITEKTARKMEKSLSKYQGEMDGINAVISNEIICVSVWDSVEDLPIGDFVLVNFLDIKAAAGDGYENSEYPTCKKQIAFRTDWIIGSKAQSTNLICIEAVGDSMIPVITPGDTLLIDMGQTELVNGNVYAVVHDGMVRVKRLYRKETSIILHSDNEDNPKYLYPIEVKNDEQLKIIGRIVNRSGSGGL